MTINRELKERYKQNGLCLNCYLPNTGQKYCRNCNSKRFRKESESWTSGNPVVDSFILKYQLKADNQWNLLEWIPYEQFTNVEYLAEGGFGKVYKAEWNKGYIKKWKQENGESRWSDTMVALKILNNSFQSMSTDFLQEVSYHKLINSSWVVQCYGVSQDPVTKDYIIVMEYIEGGNLRQYLRKNYHKLNLKNKLDWLFCIISELKNIHEKILIHGDFHIGNILISSGNRCYITDLGLSRPIWEDKNSKKVYGVLPYIAPEVLRGKPYTQSADIYSFGIVAYEIITNLPPYVIYDKKTGFYKEMTYDFQLALKICQGLRPDSNSLSMFPQLKELIEQCWDADYSKRPTANQLWDSLPLWYFNFELLNKDKNFSLEIEEISRILPFPLQTHSRVTYSSRLLDFPNLPKPQNSKEINKQFWNSKYMEFNIDELDNCLKEYKKEVNNNQNDWQNINSNFTDKLIQSWQNYNFTFQQTQDWLNIGLQPTDYNFVSWLRDTKYLTPEEVLNNYNLEQLNQEFFNWWQKANIEIPPK